jgi:hypothetical protein
MRETGKISGKRMIIFGAAILVAVAAIAINALAYAPSGNASSGDTIVGAVPENYLDVSTPVTLSTLASDVNYSVVMPSQLPSGVSFDGARSTGTSQIFLSYSVNGQLFSNDDTSFNGLLVTEQYSISDPLSPSVVVSPAVVGTAFTIISSSTSVVATDTIVSASTQTSIWQNSTIAGQLVQIASSNVSDQIQWWHNNVYIQLYSSDSLQALETMAQSMIAHPASPTSSSG